MVNLDDRIKNLSPAQRALLEQKLAAKNTETGLRMLPRKASDPRVLSCAQQQLWFLDQLAPGTPAYNVPYAIRLHGSLDTAALQRALDAIVRRHEVLRTMYLSYQGRVLPAVAKQSAVELLERDLRSVSPAEQQEQLLPQLEQAGARPFDLARDVKLRTALYRLTDESAVFLHVSHHIAWDLHSRVIFYRELEHYYRGFLNGEEVRLPDLTLQYGDYALWQHRHLQGETRQRLDDYWKAQLTGAPTALNLPTDYPRPTFQNLRGARLPLRFGATVLEDARTLARANRVTLYMTLLAAFYVFLHCHSGQDDLSVGSPFDERRHEEIEPVIGMFINTLVLRTRVEGSTTFQQLLGRVRDVVLGAIAHQDLPFDKIVDAVQPPRDLGRMPLFQANFRLKGATAPALRLEGLEVEETRVVDNATAKFDIALELPSVPESAGYLEYSTDLFAPESAERMAEDFQALLGSLLARPEIPIDQLERVRSIKARYRPAGKNG